MVSARADGSSVGITRSRMCQDTPLAMRSSATFMIGCISSMNVKTTSTITNGAIVSRMRYRSMVRSIK